MVEPEVLGRSRNTFTSSSVSWLPRNVASSDKYSPCGELGAAVMDESLVDD